MKRTLLVTVLAAAAAATSLMAQDRLKLMPGYEQFTKMQPQLTGTVVPGSITGAQFSADGKQLTYTAAGKPMTLDLATMKLTEGVAAAPATPAGGGGRAGRAGGAPPAGGRGGGQSLGGMEQAQHEMPVAPMAGCPAGGAPRGRQLECSLSPDGKFKAFYRARNFWVANADGTGETQVTTDGSVEKRIKNGSGSWVYGEELGQTTAIWWAPNSRQVGYYRFDESEVKDFYLGMNQTGIQTALDVEAYPKAGAPNPIPEVFVYDVAAGASKKFDVRDGKAFSNDVVGHYVYQMRWASDSSRADDEPHESQARTFSSLSAAIRRRPSAASSSKKSGLRAGSRIIRASPFSRTRSGSSGSRSAAASATSISTISPASSSIRSPRSRRPKPVRL
jgi:dipeptidyl-peptidase-4